VGLASDRRAGRLQRGGLAMARNPLPWHKRYHGEWLGSEKRAGMSLAEKGLYLDLLDRHYAEGSLPSDEAMLARLTGASPAEFNRAWRRVQMEFESDPSQPGRLIQPEVSAELAAMDRYAAQQAEKGRKGGRPKKAVALQRVSSGKAVVNPLESHEDLDLDLELEPAEEPAVGE